MLNSVKSWSMTCGLRLNKVDRRAVCGASISACLRRGPRGCFRSDVHCLLVNSCAAREPFPRTHPSTSSRRLDMPQVLHYISSLRYDRQGVEPRLASLVTRALPTVPLNWFRLDFMTQNKILVQFNNYFVLEIVPWRLLLKNRLLKG